MNYENEAETIRVGYISLRNLALFEGRMRKSFTKTHAYDGSEMPEYGWAVATVSAD